MAQWHDLLSNMQLDSGLPTPIYWKMEFFTSNVRPEILKTMIIMTCSLMECGVVYSGRGKHVPDYTAVVDVHCAIAGPCIRFRYTKHISIHCLDKHIRNMAPENRNWPEPWWLIVVQEWRPSIELVPTKHSMSDSRRSRLFPEVTIRWRWMVICFSCDVIIVALLDLLLVYVCFA
jgi:hypothetical protein